MKNILNIGVLCDAGKTTLTEQILFRSALLTKQAPLTKAIPSRIRWRLSEDGASR